MITEEQKKQVKDKHNLVSLIGNSITLKKQGKNHLGLCPFHAEKTPSFSVDEEGQYYYCFGCGATGDAYSWVMNYHGLDFPSAHEYLGGEITPLDASPAPRTALTEPTKPPENIEFPKLGKPDHQYPYVVNKKTVAIVCRWDATEDRKKEFRQYSFQDGRWQWKAAPEPRPLYNFDSLNECRDCAVVIVEGEKCADAASYFFRKHCIVTWSGGTKAWDKADWTPLHGRQIIIWPDADEPGREAAAGIVAHLGPYVPEIKLIDTKKLPKGYDLADFRIEGKRIQDVADYAKENVKVIRWEKPEDEPEPVPEDIEQPVVTVQNGFPLWDGRPDENQACDALLPLYRGNLCRDSESGQVHTYTGTHWTPISTQQLQSIIKADMTKALEVAGKGFSMSYLRGVSSMVALELPPHTWSTDYNLLPLSNGVLDIADRRLHPLSPDQPFNWSLPYIYDPGADCPTVKNYIAWVTKDDPDTIKLLQAWLNCCVTGRSDIQKFLELVGPGGTGKSTFLNLCSLIVGQQNTFSTELKQLSTNRFETSGLYGKRLCLISDSERYGGDVSVLKQITGGDSVRCEIKGGARFDYTPHCMVMLASNEAVQTSDSTSGLGRRRLTLKMTRRVDKEQKDPFLMQKFQAEMPGVVNWALELSHQEVTEIINNPGKKAQSSMELVAVETNNLVAWIDECVIYSPKEWAFLGARNVSLDDARDKLYPNYIQFCQDTGHKPLSSNRFVTNLRDNMAQYGMPKVRKSRHSDGVIIRGVRLRKYLDHSLPTTITKQIIEEQ